MQLLLCNGFCVIFVPKLTTLVPSFDMENPCAYFELFIPECALAFVSLTQEPWAVWPGLICLVLWLQRKNSCQGQLAQFFVVPFVALLAPLLPACFKASGVCLWVQCSLVALRAELGGNSSGAVPGLLLAWVCSGWDGCTDWHPNWCWKRQTGFSAIAQWEEGLASLWVQIWLLAQVRDDFSVNSCHLSV